MPPSTTLSLLLHPILDGRSDKTLQQWATTLTASQRQNQGSQPRTAVASISSATSENLQPNATSSTRDSRPPLNPDRERSHPRRSDRSESPHAALLRVGNLARADCKHDAQTNTARCSPRCVHLPHRRRKRSFSSFHGHTFHQSKSNGQEPKLRAHHSLATDGTLSPCAGPPKASANAAVRVFPDGLPRSPALLGLS